MVTDTKTHDMFGQNDKACLENSFFILLKFMSDNPSHGLTGGCKNLYADYDCEKWKAELYECEKRPSWMRKFCKLSCGHCKPGKGETTPIPYKPKDVTPGRDSVTHERSTRVDPVGKS